MRRIRDQRLLDALERSDRAPYAGRVWRSVREGRDPLTCWHAGGQRDDGTLDVLYTSKTRAAAVAGRRFHLYQGQPLPPSKVRYEPFELCVSLRAVVRFPDLDSLASIGFDVGSFGQLSYLEREREYPRSQEIAEACAFLGADGLLVPTAREISSNNLIVFCEQEPPVGMEVVAKSRIPHIPANVNHGPHRLGFRSNACPYSEMCCVMGLRGNGYLACLLGVLRLRVPCAACPLKPVAAGHDGFQLGRQSPHMPCSAR